MKCASNEFGHAMNRGGIGPSPCQFSHSPLLVEHYCDSELFNLRLGQFEKPVVIILVYPLEVPVLSGYLFDEVRYGR